MVVVVITVIWVLYLSRTHAAAGAPAGERLQAGDPLRGGRRLPRQAPPHAGALEVLLHGRGRQRGRQRQGGVHEEDGTGHESEQQASGAHPRIT